jgi:subfamily B ATP-binding cassette protein MsbA
MKREARSKERSRYQGLYTSQRGLEANLFLAPGEGDKVEERAG